jgi:hypothetical protein
MSLTFQNAIGNEQIVSTNGGQLAGFRNRIINGSMQVAQRGNSWVSGGGQYTLDRWLFVRGGSVSGATCQATTAYVHGGSTLYNFALVQRTPGDTQVNTIAFTTSLESINIRDLVGKTITLSFYGYCAGATVGKCNAIIYYGTGTDGNLANGLTGSAVAGAVLFAGSGIWIKNTLTVTIPSNASQLGISLQYDPLGTAGAQDFFGVTEVQLELGPVATPFEQRPYGLELSLCQRYYETTGGGTTSESAAFIPTRSDFAALNMRYQVTKRVVPTVTIYSQGGGVAGTVRQIDGTGSPANITATINSTVSELVNIVGTFQVGTHYGFNFTSSAEL